MLLRESITRNSWLLAVFAVCTTLLIAGTYLSTRERISEQKRIAEEKALLEIVPRERHDNSMLDSSISVSDKELLSLEEPSELFFATKAGQPVAFIIPAVAPDGYGGAIRLITGVNVDGTIAGVRVLAHNETPGLGDKVELKKSDWLLGFDGKSLRDPQPEQWKVKKDKGAFDQFTGATITPRATTRAVYQTLMYYQTHRKALLEQAKSTTSAPSPDAVTVQSEESQDE